MISVKSKTHWTAVVYGTVMGVVEFLPTVKDIMPANWYMYGFVGFSVLMIILRNVTVKPVSQK